MNNAIRVSTVSLVVMLVLAALGAFHHAQAASTPELDKQSSDALSALYASSPAAKALGASAKGVLVFPTVRKAAVVIGAEGGSGAMFQAGKVAGHYSLGGLQAGLEAGAEKFSYVLFFMSDKALARLRSSHGFDVGLDPNIVVVDAGAAKELSAATAQPDVYAYVFGEKGLMAGVSLQGVKITQLGR